MLHSKRPFCTREWFQLNTSSQGIEISITRRNDVVLKDDKGNDYLYSINITSEMNGVML